MRHTLIVGTVTLMASLSVHAQIYKCGSTWSQMPCGDAQQLIQAPPKQERRVLDTRPGRTLPKPADNPADAQTLARAAAACEEAVRRTMKDPEGTRIKGTRRGGVETWCTKPPTPVRYYWMVVNGRNSYGGYVGEKPYRCTLDINESSVIDITQQAEGEAYPAACVN